MISKRPLLFVGLDGPVLIPATSSHDRDEYLGAAVAPYAKSFLHWAAQPFDVHWLSDRGAGPAAYVSSLLSLPQDKVHVAGFVDSKVEALAPHKDFYWVDSELIPHEVSWLAQHGHTARMLPVNPFTGVSVEDKARLEAQVLKHAR
jgi:hypothetical protein